jgi:GTP:adenosylcobinamide-phosphate guanylyltransferase
MEIEQSVTVEYNICEYLSSYEKLTKTVLESATIFVEEGNNWRTRIKILTGLLLIANAPVHVRDTDQNRMATAILVRGLELFDEGVQEFEPRSDQTGNVVNLNTGEDLDLTNKLFNK